MTACFAAATFFAICYIVWRTQVSIGLVLAGIVLATACDHAVRWMERHRLPRWVGITIVMLALLAGLVGLVMLIIPPAVDQVESLIRNGQTYLARVTHASWYQQLDRFVDVDDLMVKLRAYVQRQPTQLAGRALTVARHFVEVLAAVATVWFLTLFMLIYGGSLTRFLLESSLPAHRRAYERAITRMHGALGAYIRGLGVLCLANAVCTGVYLAIVGVPYYLALGILSGMASLVPIAGALIAGVIISLVAMLAKGAWWGVGTAIYFVVYQQLENHLLAPLVYKHTISLNPLVSLVFVLILAEWLGIVGAVMAVPALAVGRIVIAELLKLRAQQLQLPPPPSSDPQQTGVASA
jgi:predicted PurR-regulated permease PerM